VTEKFKQKMKLNPRPKADTSSGILDVREMKIILSTLNSCESRFLNNKGKENLIRSLIVSIKIKEDGVLGFWFKSV